MRLGDVEILVISETPSFSNDVTEKPVEGGTIVDNVKQNSTILNINGAVTGDDAFQKLQQLRKYSKAGTLLKYTGRNIFTNVVIEKFDTAHTVSIRNGFEFTITLKEIRIATAQIVQIQSPDPATSNPAPKVQTQTKKVTNQGRQVPKPKPADTARTVQVAGKYVGGRFVSGTAGGATI